MHFFVFLFFTEYSSTSAHNLLAPFMATRCSFVRHNLFHQSSIVAHLSIPKCFQLQIWLP